MTATIYGTKFHAVSAPAGAGKTTAAIKHAASRAAQGQLFIIAVPSLKKTEEVDKAIRVHRSQIPSRFEFSDPFNLEVVTSKSHSGIEKALSTTMTRLHKVRRETGKGGIIIVTHEGFLMSNEIAQQEHKPFHLIWDETTTIIHHIEGNILKEMKTALFDDILTITEKDGVYTGEVKESKIAHLKERLKEQGIGIRDSVEVQTINRHLLNAAQGFCDILLGGNIENQVSMVFIYNHLKFCGYQSTTFMGANLEMTNLYRWFSMKGVEWQPHEEIDKEIDFDETHQFRLNVYYGNKGRAHTRSFLDKTNDENKTYRELFRERAMEVLGDKKTLVMKNLIDDFDYPMNYEICPWNMEGLNEYRDYENAIYIGTFNQHPAYYALIEKLGLEDLTASLHLYQFIMRMACREWDYRGTINLFIPCLKLFEPIKHLFDERRISYIPLGLEFEEAEDERKNVVEPTSEWYEVEGKSKMTSQYGFPQRKSKSEYLKWFKMFGYKSETIEVKSRDKSRPNAMKKHLIVYKTDSGLEEAKKYFG